MIREHATKQEEDDFCAGVASVVSSIFWLAAVILGILAEADGLCFNNLRFAMFRNKSETIYVSWRTDITPANWTFAAWEFIYTWNMLWVIYCVANMCRPARRLSRDGTSFIHNIFPTRFHVSWCICSVTSICWKFLWDREAFVACLFMQMFIIAGCAVTLVTSHSRVERCGALLQYKHPWDLWIARTLIQNGVVIMAVWHLFLFVINTVILLVYRSGFPMQLASAVVFGIFGLLVPLWYIVEMVFFDRWLRYTFTLYPTVSWCVIGVLVNNCHLWSPVTVTSLVILGVSLLALIIRVPVTVWRSYSNPLYIDQTIPQKQEAVAENDTTIL